MPIETKRYMILLEGNEYPIIMPNIYSTEKFEKEFTLYAVILCYCVL